jgi:hypothetical protein
MLVDASGNTYVVYATPDSNSGTDVSYMKLDPSGNVLASHMLLFRASSEVLVNGIFLSPPSSPTPYIYTMVSEDLGERDGSVFTKSNLAGTQIWQTNYNMSNESFSPLGGFVDSSDNFWGAMDHNKNGATELIMFENGPTGALVVEKNNTNIGPIHAEFYKGNWCVTGDDETATSVVQSARWGMYSPTDGHMITGAVLDPVDNGTYSYTYSPFVCYVDPAGAIDLGCNVQVTRDSDNALIGDKHFIRRYNLTGSLQWVSASYNNFLQYLSSYGSNNTIYVQRGGFTSPLFVESYDHLGNQNWVSSGASTYFVNPPVSDSTGIYTFAEDFNNHKKLNITRYNTSGAQVWTTSVATSAGGSTTRATCADAAATTNNLYTAIILPAASGNQATIQRYVQGVALGIVTTPQSSYAGGSTVPVKVSLNAPAPSGGIAVKMTSSSAKALFPNNTTATTVAIPAGSTYAIVNVHLLTVSSNLTATILGNQSGVQRSASFQVAP